ncbi:MAG: glycosyltransferase family 4 protein [Mariprofundaceae bacterium]|nr:glycosyltransferase family 4 protein [Mariprofundaceae bacterium]
MRILYLTDGNLAPHKAPQIHVSQFLKHWHRAGHNVLLRAPRTQDNMPNFEFPHTWLAHSDIRLLGDWLFQKRMYRQLKKELQEKRWDVVYTRQISTFPALYRLCREFAVPVVCEVNGFLLDNYATGGASALKMYLVKRMESAIMRYSSLVVVPYDALRSRMIEQYAYLNDKIVVIENGVDESLFKHESTLFCREKLKLDSEVFYVGFVGSFDFYHDVKTMFDAYSMIAEKIQSKRVRYLMVGDGDLRQAMQMYGQKIGIETYVDFVGSVPHAQVADYINASDVMVSLQPKERMEKLGEASSLKVKEYLACGVPTILSHPAKCKSAFQGICVHVEPENPIQFADAVIQVSQGDKPSYNAEKLGETYSWSQSALRLLNHIKNMRG